jgi:hypothetical protein
MIGLGRPMAISFQQGMSMEWFSSARNFQWRRRSWTAAMQAMGVSAMWMAIATPNPAPYRHLFVLINAHLMCAVGLDHRDAAASSKGLKFSLMVNVLAGADGRGARVRQCHILIGHLPGES